MPRPPKLDPAAVDAWLAEHPGWARDRTEQDRIVRTFPMPDFAAALSFAVRLGMLADKRDHHPEILIGWGKAQVSWTTHDAGGVTELDLQLAQATEALLP